jgi:hypothetical protein
MPNDDQTRWTVTVSKATDIALRTFLAQRGLKKGDLSVFIEEAVQWRIRELTLSGAGTQGEELPQDVGQALVEEPRCVVQEPTSRAHTNMGAKAFTAAD